MKCNIVDALVKDQIALLDRSRRVLGLLPHAVQLEKLLRRWTGDGVLVIPFNDSQLLINVTVTFIKDIEQFLEFIESGLDINFDKTADTAYTHSTYRTFTAGDCHWLRVDANLIADGPGCRKVIKGYSEPQPIYEIECLAVVDAPTALQAPSPEQLPAPDDIPF